MKGNQERLSQILLSPVISEKGSRQADKAQQFVFKVLPNSNKQEIKQAVELLFDVQVRSVQIANMKGKRKNFGRVQGKRQDWKKAYVGLKPGYDIDFASE